MSPKLTGEVDEAPRRRPLRISISDYLGKLRALGLDVRGRLIADSTPIAPPIGYKRQPTMVEIVRDAVRSEHLRQAALDAGMETFEESEDFDVPDEQELHSPWENDFDPPIAELTAAGQAEVDRKKAAVPPADGPGTPAPAPPSPDED